MPLMLAPPAGEQWLSREGLSLVDSFQTKIIPEEQIDFFPLAPGLKNKMTNPADPALVEPYDYGFDPLGSQLF
jgi:hypothetical protein